MPVPGGTAVLDEALVAKTISRALETGGDFAEVFVEDKRSSSALLDDGKIEELTSGRDRGAGIRVVVGDTTGFAHTADLSDKGLGDAAQAAAAAANAPVRTAFRAPLHSVCIIIIIFVAVILTDCSLCSLARLSPWLVFVHTG